MHYDMEDLLEQANEIQESLGRSYAVPDELDEADLEAGTHLDLFIYHPCLEIYHFRTGCFAIRRGRRGHVVSSGHKQSSRFHRRATGGNNRGKSLTSFDKNSDPQLQFRNHRRRLSRLQLKCITSVIFILLKLFRIDPMTPRIHHVVQDFVPDMIKIDDSTQH